MPRRPAAPAPVTTSADQYSGVSMCLTVAVLHVLYHQHYQAGLFWLFLGLGLGLRAWLRQHRLTNALLVGACLAVAAALGWQALRSVPRVRVPHVLQLLPSAQGCARAVQVCQALTRTFATLL